jgi:hypothetical protein
MPGKENKIVTQYSLCIIVYSRMSAVTQIIKQCNELQTSGRKRLSPRTSNYPGIKLAGHDSLWSSREQNRVPAEHMSVAIPLSQLAQQCSLQNY